MLIVLLNINVVNIGIIAKARFDTRIDKICPKEVCTHLGYCNKTIESNKNEIEEIKPIDNSNSTCILCNYVMNILSNYIQSQSTEEEIEENYKKFVIKFHQYYKINVENILIIMVQQLSQYLFKNLIFQ